MSRTTIASLAILKTNFERLGTDYVDNFLPLVVHGLGTVSDEVVSLPVLKQAIRAEFALSLPANALRQLLRRAARAGYLKREGGVYYRVPDALARHDFRQVRDQALGDMNAVVERLREFAAHSYGVEWSAEDAERAILALIGDWGLDVLYAVAEDRMIELPKSGPSSRFIAAAFVANAQESDAELFSKIETFIKGMLLLNVLYFPDTGRLNERFRDTKVYLDTRLLIYALGHAGPELREPVMELLALLRSYGAQVRCFQHTVDEVRGILDAAAARIRRNELRDAYGPVIEYFVGRGLSSTDIDLLSARLPHQLAFLGIQVEEKPPYEREYVIDEAGFEARLMEVIGYVNPRACQHDVDSISAVARIRRGRQSYAIERCRAVFVTTNGALARVTREFFQPEATPGAVALCITDYALANLLWLKNPTVAPQLPKRRLVADAYAAMQPPDDLWKAYLAEIARLEERGDITADDYYLLRYSLAARKSLMDMTRGEPEAFSEGTPLEVLEIAKRHVRADLEQELTQERRRRADMEVAIAARDAAAGQQLRAVRDISGKVATLVANGLLLLTMAVLAIGTLFTFPWDLPAVQSAWFGYLLATAQAAGFGYSMLSMWRGTTLAELRDSLRALIAMRVERALVSWLQIRDPADLAAKLDEAPRNE